jgi:subtilase family serine protease
MIELATTLDYADLPAVTNITQAAALTPLRVATAYNFPSNNGAGVKIGIVSLGGNWLASDFDNAMSDLGLNTSITSGNIHTVYVDGASPTFSSSRAYSTENTLDLYCVAAIAPKANITIYIGDVNTATTYTQLAKIWADTLSAAIDGGSDIVTMSYGLNEYYVTNLALGNFLSAPLAKAVNSGTIVLSASGDFGTTQSGPASYTGVTYPASDPRVLAIGGTELIVNYSTNARVSETPLFNTSSFSTGFSSGGGISALFSVPSYQVGLGYQTNTITLNTATHVVSNEIIGPLTALSGRGVPDISGPMNTYAMWYNGSVVGVGGTSASTPIMAGLLARYISIKGSKFSTSTSIHSLLYSGDPTRYNDIIGSPGDDSNADTIVSGSGPVYTLSGYSTRAGWDPVTGLGSINNATALYNTVFPPTGKYKSTGGVWSSIKAVYVKTAGGWQPVANLWAKTTDGWQVPK